MGKDGRSGVVAAILQPWGGPLTEVVAPSWSFQINESWAVCVRTLCDSKSVGSVAGSPESSLTRVESTREFEEGRVRREERHKTLCCPLHGTFHSQRPLPSGALTSHRDWKAHGASES